MLYEGVKLEDYKLITSAEYLLLEHPIFVGQTRVNGETKQYYICWEDDGKLYKTLNTL
jgi:hypothetical protein